MRITAHTSTWSRATRPPAGWPTRLSGPRSSTLRAQQAKRRASGHLSSGDTDSALKEIRQAQQDIARARSGAPESMAPDLDEEARELSYLEQETEIGSAQRAGKYMSASSSRRLQKRGRSYQTPPVPPMTPPPAPPAPPPTAPAAGGDPGDPAAGGEPDGDTDAGPAPDQSAP